MSSRDGDGVAGGGAARGRRLWSAVLAGLCWIVWFSSLWEGLQSLTCGISSRDGPHGRLSVEESGVVGSTLERATAQ